MPHHPSKALTLLVALCWMTLLSASTAAAIKTRTTPRICALDMAEVSAPECLEGRANPTYVWVSCECRSAKIAPNTARDGKTGLSDGDGGHKITVRNGPVLSDLSRDSSRKVI